MIVKCEFCKTKFRLDLERVKSQRVRVRCSRCGNVFEVSKPSEEPNILNNSFVEPRPSFSREKGMPASVVPGRTTPPASRRQSRPGRRNPFFWIIVFIIIGTGFYALLKYDYLGDLFGTSLNSVAKREFAPTIVSDSVQAYFLDNKQAGQIFVVKGDVVNNSPEPASFILLEGEIYNSKGETTQNQRCFAGNEMTQEELTHLAVAEIQNQMMNREGRDLKNVHIPPQGRVPFMLVYHNLSNLENLTDYSVEVVSFENE